MAFASYTIRAAREMNDVMFTVTEFGRQGSADRPHSFSCGKGGIFVEHALWFGLLDHRGRLVRMPASVCGAYDCSVSYVGYKATQRFGSKRLVSETMSTCTDEVFWFFSVFTLSTYTDVEVQLLVFFILSAYTDVEVQLLVFFILSTYTDVEVQLLVFFILSTYTDVEVQLLVFFYSVNLYRCRSSVVGVFHSVNLYRCRTFQLLMFFTFNFWNKPVYLTNYNSTSVHFLSLFVQCDSCTTTFLEGEGGRSGGGGVEGERVAGHMNYRRKPYLSKEPSFIFGFA